jgi:hypothetical protein
LSIPQLKRLIQPYVKSTHTDTDRPLLASTVSLDLANLQRIKRATSAQTTSILLTLFGGVTRRMQMKLKNADGSSVKTQLIVYRTPSRPWWVIWKHFKLLNRGSASLCIAF